MSAASIEAALRLDIAELQQKLTLANAETDKWKTKVENGSRDGARSVDGLTRAYGRFSSAAQSSGRIISGNTALFLQAEKAATAAARAQSRGGGGMQIGGAAMQIQDIAVQMQMGTKASTILAQQGSQLLSYFGSGGMIAGGLIAIGGAFVTAGQTAKDNLAKATQEAAALHTELTGIATVGTLEEVTAGMQKLATFAAQARASLPAQAGVGELGNDILSALGTGPTRDERFTAGQQQLMMSAEMRVQLEARALEISAQEAEITALRAQGREKEADEMQRQANLAREIIRIQSSGFSDPAKAQLTADAEARSAASATAAATAQRAKDEATVKQLREKLAAQELAQMSPEARFNALRGQQGALFDSMDSKGGLAFDKSTEGLREWAKWLEKINRPDTMATVLGMLDEALRLEKEMAAASAEVTAGVEQQARAAQEQYAAAEEKQREQKKAEEKKKTEQQAAQNDIRAEAMLLQMTAAGRGEEVEVLKEAMRIKEQTGVTDQQALSAARQMVTLRRDAKAAEGGQKTEGGAAAESTSSRAARMFTEGDRQAGWLHPSVRAGRAKLMGSAGGGGLDQFHRNQRTDSAWELAQKQPSAWTQLQQRAAGNAAVAQQEAASKPPADMTALFQQLIQITQKGLLGA